MRERKQQARAIKDGAILNRQLAVTRLAISGLCLLRSLQKAQAFNIKTQPDFISSVL
jgi:hypothetical protein